MSEWVKQYDPNEGRDYYWNATTGEAVWDEPDGFQEGGTNEDMEAVLRIQSAFRGAKVRGRTPGGPARLWAVASVRVLVAYAVACGCMWPCAPAVHIALQHAPLCVPRRPTPNARAVSPSSLPCLHCARGVAGIAAGAGVWRVLSSRSASKLTRRRLP